MKQFLVRAARIFSYIAVFSGAFIFSSDFFNRRPLQPGLDALGVSGTGQVFDLSFFFLYFIVPILIIVVTGVQKTSVLAEGVSSGSGFAVSTRSNAKRTVIVVAPLIFLGLLLGYLGSKLLLFSALGS